MKIAAKLEGEQAKVLLLVILIGLNLRPFLVAVGPVMEQVVAGTGISYESASLLTLVPMALMGIGALVVASRPALIAKQHALLVALMVLALGNLLRLLAGNGTILLLSAFVSGLAVALIQSIMPGLIKQSFQHNTARVVGCYSASLMLGGALGAHAIPVLIAQHFDWQQALAWLALPCFVAGIATALFLPKRSARASEQVQFLPLMAKRRTWELMASFGMVNGAYASLVTWLASYYQLMGWSTEKSSQLIVTLAACQAVSALFVPMCMKPQHDRRPWMLLMLALLALGFFGFIYVPETFPHLWAGACGVGLGGAFALSIIIALEHFSHVHKANALTALMQGGGFMLASLFPFLFSLWVQVTGEYTDGWIMHLVLICLTSLICINFNPKSYSLAMADRRS
ncbi:cyanate transporter [Photobacterium sp. MCCC 1A19761]|uniref:cyanate transporter n=1 Tax=Photobacterium sp. MCCC 1A19761 TaxID=3115000 RepID=UPI00307D8272